MRMIAVLVLSGYAFVLGTGCPRARQPGPAEKAGRAVDDAAEKTKDATKDAAHDTKKAVEGR